MNQHPIFSCSSTSSLLPIWPPLQILMRSTVHQVCPESTPRTFGHSTDFSPLTPRAKLLHRVLLHLVVHLGSGHAIWCPVRYRQHHWTHRARMPFWSYGRARDHWTRVSGGRWRMGASAAAITHPDGEPYRSFLSIWFNFILYLEVSCHPSTIDGSDGVSICRRGPLFRSIFCLLPTYGLRRISRVVCSCCDGGRG
jgi:hypothetical protein